MAFSNFLCNEEGLYMSILIFLICNLSRYSMSGLFFLFLSELPHTDFKNKRHSDK